MSKLHFFKISFEKSVAHFFKSEKAVKYFFFLYLIKALKSLFSWCLLKYFTFVQICILNYEFHFVAAMYKFPRNDVYILFYMFEDFAS